MSAKHFNCFDDYENVVLECHKCHWKGTFKQGSVEYYDELMDCSCPNCDYFDAPTLAIVSYPTLEELRANSDRPGIRELVQKIDRSVPSPSSSHSLSSWFSSHGISRKRRPPKWKS